MAGEQRPGDQLRNAKSLSSPAPVDTRVSEGLAPQPTRCAYCGCACTISRVEITAVMLAERLWALTVCPTCFLLLVAAIQLELAGGGPGGHFEPPAKSPGFAGGFGAGHDELGAGAGDTEPR